jgi:hypothetical protein
LYLRIWPLSWPSALSDTAFIFFGKHRLLATLFTSPHPDQSNDVKCRHTPTYNDGRVWSTHSRIKSTLKR